jgi:hypothetical protein
MPQLLFINNTHMPICISGWNKIMDGLSELNCITIDANTEIRVKSENGKWYISSLFLKEEHKKIWEKEELDFDSRIAIFQSIPFLNSDYIPAFTEVFIENFTLTYDDLNKSVTWNYIKK